ncbi:hypothetical protein RB195_007724 [Necator americanus]|uniref:Carbohydrate sulfotransferase n=1 Tax=Necator americanus TaxID=51031 RepID=A0ABR1BYQ6_NECAM
MSPLNRILLTFFLLYLLWKYYYTTRLLLICSDVKRFNAERRVLPTRIQYVAKIKTTNHCVGDDAAKCVPALYSYKQRYRVAPKYHLLGCAIEKNFSTMLTAILCYLFDEEGFQRSKRNLSSEIFHMRFCGKRNEYDSLATIDKKLKLDLHVWKMIAVVREPVERFVSGFADKCLRERVWRKFPSRCNGCKTNMTCFMERMYARMMRRARGLQQRANFDDDHFFPQNWRCEFNSRLYDYQILQFDAIQPSPFFGKLLEILKKNKVPEQEIDFINKSISTQRTTHSTTNTLEQRETRDALLSNDYLTNLLIKMYYFDFVLFGYPIPPVLVKNE